jgi:hypothetical protein
MVLSLAVQTAAILAEHGSVSLAVHMVVGWAEVEKEEEVQVEALAFAQWQCQGQTYYYHMRNQECSIGSEGKTSADLDH